MNEQTGHGEAETLRRETGGGPETISDQALLEGMFNLTRKIQSLRRPAPESLLSDSEFMVLSPLSAAGGETMTMKQLSEKATIPPSLISRIVRGLEEGKRYVERLPSREDRRQVYIRITPEGERTLRSYVKRRIERMRPVVRELNDEQRRVVWRSIEIFETILEQT